MEEKIEKEQYYEWEVLIQVAEQDVENEEHLEELAAKMV
jgi:hypothetical protein